jgi:rSAM/selenodomain-associated transferase 1
MDIVIFARYWESGRVKTRLCPPLSFTEAARLYRLMLDVLVTRLKAVSGISTVIAFEPDSARSAFARRYPEIALEPQRGENLGEKLVHVVSKRKEPCLITGSDCPTTPLDSFQRSAQSLREGADVIIAPTEDGGAHILGARPECARWFAGIPWSSGTECLVLEDRARNNGWRCQRLPLWYDVDRPEDLPRVLRHLDECASRGEVSPAILEKNRRMLTDLNLRLASLSKSADGRGNECD